MINNLQSNLKSLESRSALPGNSSWSFLFSYYKYKHFIENLGISYGTFYQEWSNNTALITELNSRPLVSGDWIWAFYLPLVSQIKVILESKSYPIILGLSGLPGSGKSTFGKTLEFISSYMNIPINVISMDDFYLPSSQLDKAMKGNPWKVPRGLPGSHSITEIEESLNRYAESGVLIAPQFDKSLRSGLGERSGVIKGKPKVLILEGWFLGCLPLNYPLAFRDDHFNLALTEEEITYRNIVQDCLYSYKPIWKKFFKTWHLKAKDFSYTMLWKSQQEQNLLKTYGSALQGNQLNSFIRMINTSIPQKSLQNIDSDVTLVLNKSRNISDILCKINEY